MLLDAFVGSGEALRLFRSATNALFRGAKGDYVDHNVTINAPPAVNMLLLVPTPPRGS